MRALALILLPFLAAMPAAAWAGGHSGHHGQHHGRHHVVIVVNPSHGILTGPVRHGFGHRGGFCRSCGSSFAPATAGFFTGGAIVPPLRPFPAVPVTAPHFHARQFLGFTTAQEHGVVIVRGPPQLEFAEPVENAGGNPTASGATPSEVGRSTTGAVVEVVRGTTVSRVVVQ